MWASILSGKRHHWLVNLPIPPWMGYPFSTDMMTWHNGLFQYPIRRHTKRSYEVSRSQDRVSKYHIALKFGGRLGSNAAETPVKFQNDWKPCALEISRDLRIRRHMRYWNVPTGNSSSFPGPTGPANDWSMQLSPECMRQTTMNAICAININHAHGFAVLCFLVAMLSAPRQGLARTVYINLGMYYVGYKLCLCIMMMSSNGNIFRVTGHLCGEFTGPRWIPRTKASDTDVWCFLWFAPE